MQKLQNPKNLQKPIIGITPDYAYDTKRFLIHEDYIHAIQRAGGIPILLMPEDQSFPDYVDGILFSGGGDIDPLLFGEEPIAQNGEISPLRDAYELWLCEQAFLRDIPIFGICRGMQVMNIAAGGGIYQDIAVQHGSQIKHSQQAPRRHATHSIQVQEDGLLYALWQKKRVVVNSVHHQAVSTLGDGFSVVASSTDGLTEAIARKQTGFVLGVQWHPEAMYTQEQDVLFQHFVEAAALYRKQK